MESVKLAFVGGVGWTELMVIIGIAVLLFGTKRLPDLGRNLARGIKEFKDGLKDAPSEKPDNKDS